MKLDTDRIVGLSAMAVGVCSLVIILYQTQLMREAQHASALPYLAIAVSSRRGRTPYRVPSASTTVYGDHWRLTSARIVPEPL